MALKKKNKFQQIAAAVKRDMARRKLERNKPKAKGNRKITRPTGSGSTLKTRLKQRALNIKGNVKAAVRNAPKNLAKAKKSVKGAYRKVDTKMERKALVNKAKSAVSKKAKSVGKNLKAQANFRLNKLTGTGTKGRAASLKNAKSKVRMAKTNAAARLRGVGVKAKLKGMSLKSSAKNKVQRLKNAKTNTAAKLRGVKVKLQLKKGKLSNAARNWSQKKKAAMQKLWDRNKK